MLKEHTFSNEIVASTGPSIVADGSVKINSNCTNYQYS